MGCGAYCRKAVKITQAETSLLIRIGIFTLAHVDA